MSTTNTYKRDLLGYFRMLRHVGVYRNDMMRDALIERFVSYLLCGDFDKWMSDDDYNMLMTLFSKVSSSCPK